MPVKNVPCSISACGRKFARVENMAQHRRAKHSENDVKALGNASPGKPVPTKKDIPCTHSGCPRLFAHTTDMQQHLESHAKKLSKTQGRVPALKAKMTGPGQHSSSEGQFRPFPEGKGPSPTIPGTISKSIGLVREGEIGPEGNTVVEEDNKNLCASCKKTFKAPDQGRKYCSKSCENSHELRLYYRQLGVPNSSLTMNDRRRNRAGNTKAVCRGVLDQGKWGCGRRFPNSFALAEHFRSLQGLECIQPLYDQESSPDGGKGLLSGQGFPRALLICFPELESLNPTPPSNVERDAMCHTPNSDIGIAHLFDPVAVSPKKSKHNPNLGGQWFPFTAQTQQHVGVASMTSPDEWSSIKDHNIETSEIQGRSDCSTSNSFHLSDHNDGKRAPGEDGSGAIQTAADEITKTVSAVIETAGHAQTALMRQETGKPTLDLSSQADRGVTGPSASKTFERYGIAHGRPEEPCIIPSTMDKSRHEITAQSMENLAAMMEANLNIQDRGSGTSSGSGHNQPDCSTNETDRVPSHDRKRSANSSEETGNSGDDQDRKRPKGVSPSKSSLGKERRFACPYYRRNPENHREFRSCAGPGFPTILRVKEHIYRQHELPALCLRCHSSFKSDQQLEVHHRQPEACQVQDGGLPEGLTKGQKEELRKRKKPSKKGDPFQSEEDQWRDVYKILFPNDQEDLIPSPFYEDTLEDFSLHQDGILHDLQQVMCDELPRVVQTTLEGRGAFADATCGSRLQHLVANSIREAVPQVFHRYNQRQELHIATKPQNEQFTYFGIDVNDDALLHNFSTDDASLFTQGMEHGEVVDGVSGGSTDVEEVYSWMEGTYNDLDSSDSLNFHLDDEVFKDLTGFGSCE